MVQARSALAESKAALGTWLAELEGLEHRLAAGVDSLERREAVLAADEAAGLVSLAADAIRAGSQHLAQLEEGDLRDELLDIAAAARAAQRR